MFTFLLIFFLKFNFILTDPPEYNYLYGVPALASIGAYLYGITNGYSDTTNLAYLGNFNK